MRQLKPSEIQSLLQQSEHLTLIDVREPSEFNLCQIHGSINIPVGQIASRLMDFELDQELVTICHHGMRSHAVGEFLEAKGFTKVINLLGGIDAWAREVDPTMPRY